MNKLYSFVVLLLITGQAWSQDITTSFSVGLALQDAAASTTVVASVGSNGTLVGAGNTVDSSVTGPGSCLPKGLTFDASNDGVDCTDQFAAGTADFTVSCWFKTSATATQRRVVGKKNGLTATGTAGWVVYINSLDSITFLMADGTTRVFYSINEDVDNDVWHHLAVVVTGRTSVKMYLDGVDKGVTASDGPLSSIGSVTTSTQLMIAARHLQTETLDGEVSGVRLYTRALTANDVRSLFWLGRMYGYHSFSAIGSGVAAPNYVVQPLSEGLIL